MRATWSCLMLLVACNQTPTANKDVTAAPSGSGTTSPATDVMDECPSMAAGDSCADSPTARPATKAPTHFGTPFQLQSEEALSAAVARIGDVEETVQVTGTVEAVCKKKGCWMELRDGDTSAKVFTYSGDFLLPVNTAKGRKAIVEGKLKATTMTKKFAQHLAGDEGKDPNQVTGPVRKLVINAQSIKLL